MNIWIFTSKLDKFIFVWVLISIYKNQVLIWKLSESFDNPVNSLEIRELRKREKIGEIFLMRRDIMRKYLRINTWIDYSRFTTCIVLNLFGKLKRICPNLIDLMKIMKKKSLEEISKNNIDWAKKKWYFLVVFLSTIKEVAREGMSKKYFLRSLQGTTDCCKGIVRKNNRIIITNKSR